MKLSKTTSVKVVTAGIIIISSLVWLLMKSSDKTATVEINGLVIPVEIVTKPEDQSRGLSNRASLASGNGMLFIFPQKEIARFWMKDMKFPIDIIWIADDMVVGVSADVPPEPNNDNLKIYSPPEPADQALEVNAGFAAAHDIKAGDKIKTSPVVR